MVFPELCAIVNNAGIGYCRMLEFTEPEKIHRLLDVNAFGMLRVCQKFIPLLRGHGGRIVNVTSIAGSFMYIFVC